LILGRNFNPKDPVNQPATVGLYGQVSPPATPHLNHVFADGTYITWMAKRNLASMRDQGNSCLKIYSIFLLIYSWYSGPGHEDRITSGSYLDLQKDRAEKHSRDRQGQGLDEPADDYLPDFLK